MKLLGRLLLLAVGVALCIFNIPALLNSINAFKAIDWSTGTDAVNQAAVIIGDIVVRGINLLVALVALVCALIGKATFLLGLIAILLIAGVVFTVVTGIQNGTMDFSNWRTWFDTIVGFIIPIGYFLGTLFISFGKKK